MAVGREAGSVILPTSLAQPPEEYEPAIWRVVNAGLATYGEVATVWSIDDLHDANYTLNVREYVEKVSHERAMAQVKR